MNTAQLRWIIFFEDKCQKIMTEIAYCNFCVSYAQKGNKDNY